jgi:hypothetical protein
MSKIFTIRVGDRMPWLAYDFGFSLATAVSVSFSARDQDTNEVFIDHQPAQIANGTYTINGVSQDLTPADGIVFYPWGAGDTAAARKSVMGLFHITWPGALQETLPSEGYERIVIAENF